MHTLPHSLLGQVVETMVKHIELEEVKSYTGALGFYWPVTCTCAAEAVVADCVVQPLQQPL